MTRSRLLLLLLLLAGCVADGGSSRAAADPASTDTITSAGQDAPLIRLTRRIDLTGDTVAERIVVRAEGATMRAMTVSLDVLRPTRSDALFHDEWPASLYVGDGESPETAVRAALDALLAEPAFAAAADEVALASEAEILTLDRAERRYRSRRRIMDGDTLNELQWEEITALEPDTQRATAYLAELRTQPTFTYRVGGSAFTIVWSKMVRRFVRVAAPPR